MAGDIGHVGAGQLRAQLPCVPLSRPEPLVDGLVPRRSTRLAWCNDGDGLALRAARRMSGLGYTDGHR